MERVDIGGAAKRGRPQIPAPTTVTMDDSGFQIQDPVEKQAHVAVPDRVQAAVEPGAKVAYPEDHPANNEDMEMDASGRLMPGKGQILTRAPEALGDVQQGFVSDQDVVKRNLDQLNDLEKQEVDQAATAVPAPAQVAAAAMAQAPAPVEREPLPQIEVTFHLEIGAIISYYNKVIQQGPWLILVVSSESEGGRRDRFIPRPRKNEEGVALSIDVIITGEDRSANRLSVTPLGMQFTVDDYDFVVMMVNEPEEE